MTPVLLYLTAGTLLGAGLLIRENGHRFTSWSCLAIGCGVAGMTAAVDVAGA